VFRKLHKAFLANALLVAVLAAGFISPAFLTFGQENSTTSAGAENSLANGDLAQRLRAQIDEIEQEIEVSQSEAKELTKEIDIVNNQIRQQELEVRQLNYVIQRTDLEITSTEKTVEELGVDITDRRTFLAGSIYALDQFESDNLLSIILKHRRLSDFFQTINQMEALQGNILASLEDLRQLKSDLEVKKDDLGRQNEEYSRLKSLEVTQQRSLEVNKSRKQTVLKSKETVISQKKRDLATLKSQLFYLEKTGISVEDAVKFADLAASRAGIRTAFLLAILEVETGKRFQEGVISVGTNLGTGHWNRDMYQCYKNLGKPKTAERQKAAYFEITDELNYDPDAMPVSRAPSYGCGGAMGPAQFIPTTWNLYKNKVAALTGHNPPDPWNVEDAFTAAAVYLAEAGATAQTLAAEKRAAMTYIGGPRCTSYTCRTYANNVVTLAAVIDRSL